MRRERCAKEKNGDGEEKRAKIVNEKIQANWHRESKLKRGRVSNHFSLERRERERESRKERGKERNYNTLNVVGGKSNEYELHANICDRFFYIIHVIDIMDLIASKFTSLICILNADKYTNWQKIEQGCSRFMTLRTIYQRFKCQAKKKARGAASHLGAKCSSWWKCVIAVMRLLRDVNNLPTRNWLIELIALLNIIQSMPSRHGRMIRDTFRSWDCQFRCTECIFPKLRLNGGNIFQVYCTSIEDALHISIQSGAHSKHSSIHTLNSLIKIIMLRLKYPLIVCHVANDTGGYG